MKHITTITAALATAAAVGAAGCASSGLSPREAAGRGQSALLYSLYDEGQPAAQQGPARPLRLPTSVAVVQVGEVAPPQSMIEALRKEPGVFARVDSLPGTEASVPYYANDAHVSGRTQPPRPSLTALRRMAADAGMEYVLLVGGTIDHGSSGTPLNVLDLTIVGAFLVPGNEVRGTARASSALIDVRSGRVVVHSSAEAARKTYAPRASVDGAETKLLEALRDDALDKLAQRVLADARTRAAAAGNASEAGLRYETASEAGVPIF